jgi:hypothetical protein
MCDCRSARWVRIKATFESESSTHLAHEVHEAYPSVLALPLLDLLLHLDHVCTEGDDLSIVVVYEVVGIALDEGVPLLS